MARYLVQSKIDVELRGDNSDPNDPKPPQLPPGRMRLYGYYRPSLQAARYGVQTRQTITAIKGDDKTSTTTTKFNTSNEKDIIQQEFEVIAPQFSLDPKLINSYYPPTGHSDEGRILPHIVFQDPHVPWYRPAGISDWMTDAVDTESLEDNPVPNIDGHNLMPWMALVVFKPDDLTVSSTDAQLLGLTANGMQAYDPTKLPANGAYQMTVGDYLSNIKSRVCYEAGYQISHAGADPLKSLEDTADDEYKDMKTSKEVMTAIFPTKAQIKTVLGGGDTIDLSPLKAQRLLAHVRHLNTIGFPDAGVEDEGIFSVVVSSMSGDQNEDAPTTHIVHLVSLEHIDSTLTNPKSSFLRTDNSDRVGLVSLYSWTYTCIPGSVSFKQTMTNLAKAAQPLRPPKEVLQGLQAASSDKVKQALFERLNAGYTVARWRTATGEETVSFNRGPLVPLPTQDVPTSAIPVSDKRRLWPALSMTGKDYQIFDKQTGIMDTTYSGAWSLGKLMSISDSVFNAALMRLRSTIWKNATSAVRMFVTGIDPAPVQVGKGAAAISGAAVLTNGATFSGPVTRVNKPNDLTIPPPMDDASVAQAFREAVDLAADNLSSTLPDGTNKPSIYNGFDGTPSNNSDWEVVLNWVHDIMYLATIPSHILFPEPSHLESMNTFPTPASQTQFNTEALRFFHIDHAWIDCFLDGALSVANHLEPDFDYTRLRIKAIINKFLSTQIGTNVPNPPVPRYGFIIRSAVIKATPDIKLTARAWNVTTLPGGQTKAELRDCLVRHTRMDDNTILSLVDCLPEEIAYFTLAQPAHQQRFAIECNLQDPIDPRIRKITPNIAIKRLYTDPKQAPPVPGDITQSLEWKAFEDRDFDKYHLPTPNQAGFYDAQTRCIQPAKIAQAVNDVLQKWGQDPSFNSKPPYDDAVPNSCILGLELNDPAYELRIDGPTTTDTPPTTPFPTWTRKLWLGEVVPSPVTARTSKPTGNDLTNAPKPDPTPTTVPQGNINPGQPDPSTLVPAPLATFANSTTIIPRAPLKVKVNIREPFANSNDTQFELLVHPSYKPPPPRPFRDPQGTFTRDIYSPLDFLPTDTISLYDIVFAVRRRNNFATTKTLKSLTIEIPVADPAKLLPPDKWNEPIEPLLNSTDYSEVGIAMCSNQRFVPTLFSGTASTNGSPYWDGRPILGITLVPRSGLRTGALPLLNDGKASEASVRLTEPRVLQINNNKAKVPIAQFVNGQATNPGDFRGRALIRMIERYGDDTRDEYQVSWCAALKKRGGDVDLLGNPV